MRVEAPQSGGGQERGMRSGTLPTPLCVGMGAACELAMQEMEVRSCFYSIPSPEHHLPETSKLLLRGSCCGARIIVVALT